MLGPKVHLLTHCSSRALLPCLDHDDSKHVLTNESNVWTRLTSRMLREGFAVDGPVWRLFSGLVMLPSVTVRRLFEEMFSASVHCDISNTTSRSLLAWTLAVQS